MDLCQANLSSTWHHLKRSRLHLPLHQLLCQNICSLYSVCPCVQLSWELAARDKRWFRQRSFQKSFADGRVDMFFYDTVPFVQRYYQEKWATNIGRCNPWFLCCLYTLRPAMRCLALPYAPFCCPALACAAIFRLAVSIPARLP